MKKRIVILGLLGAVLTGIMVSICIFYSNDKATLANEVPADESKLPTVNLKMVGDNLIHNTIYFAAKTDDGYNFDMLFKNVKSEIEESDIAVINQETIFVNDSKKYSSF